MYEGLIQISDNEVQEVAVKTTKENAGQSDKDDFLKEAKAMSRLKHSHIVNMIGVCLDSEQVSKALTTLLANHFKKLDQS